MEKRNGIIEDGETTENTCNNLKRFQHILYCQFYNFKT